MRKPLKKDKSPRRQRRSGVRPRLDDEDATRVETPKARERAEALSEQVTLPRLPDLEDSGSWTSDAPNGEPEPVPDAPPSEDEPTVRQRPDRLPQHMRGTITSRHDVDRRALPFTKPEGRRDEDEPLELAATVKAPSSESLELGRAVELAADGESRDPISSLPPRSESPWGSYGVDAEALPSSMMPPLEQEPVDEESIRRAQRATLVLWIAVAAVVAITLLAMLWT